jgi:hypothetical protein
MDDRGSRVRFPAGAGNFSLNRRVQNGSGAHPPSYPMVIRGSFPGGKAAGAWSWPLSCILCRGQRMSGFIPSLPKYVFMAWCSIKKTAQGQLCPYPSPHTAFQFVQSTHNTRFVNVTRRVCPKVSGHVAWSENCKWYSSLPLSVVVSLFCESV